MLFFEEVAFLVVVLVMDEEVAVFLSHEVEKLRSVVAEAPFGAENSQYELRCVVVTIKE